MQDFRSISGRVFGPSGSDEVKSRRRREDRVENVEEAPVDERAPLEEKILSERLHEIYEDVAQSAPKKEELRGAERSEGKSPRPEKEHSEKGERRGEGPRGETRDRTDEKIGERRQVRHERRETLQEKLQQARDERRETLQEKLQQAREERRETLQEKIQQAREERRETPRERTEQPRQERRQTPQEKIEQPRQERRQTPQEKIEQPREERTQPRGDALQEGINRERSDRARPRESGDGLQGRLDERKDAQAGRTEARRPHEEAPREKTRSGFEYGSTRQEAAKSSGIAPKTDFEAVKAKILKDASALGVSHTNPSKVGKLEEYVIHILPGLTPGLAKAAAATSLLQYAESAYSSQSSTIAELVIESGAAPLVLADLLSDVADLPYPRDLARLLTALALTRESSRLVLTLLKKASFLMHFQKYERRGSGEHQGLSRQAEAKTHTGPARSCSLETEKEAESEDLSKEESAAQRMRSGIRHDGKDARTTTETDEEAERLGDEPEDGSEEDGRDPGRDEEEEKEEKEEEQEEESGHPQEEKASLARDSENGESADGSTREGQTEPDRQYLLFLPEIPDAAFELAGCLAVIPQHRYEVPCSPEEEPRLTSRYFSSALIEYYLYLLLLLLRGKKFPYAQFTWEGPDSTTVREPEGRTATESAIPLESEERAAIESYTPEELAAETMNLLRLRLDEEYLECCAEEIRELSLDDLACDPEFRDFFEMIAP
jgi:hypothetical protein